MGMMFSFFSNPYDSYLMTYEIPTDIHTFKNVSEVLSGGFQNEYEIRGEIQPNVVFHKPDSIFIECY